MENDHDPREDRNAANDIEAHPDSLPHNHLHHINPWARDRPGQDEDNVEHFEWNPAPGIHFSRTSYRSSPSEGFPAQRGTDLSLQCSKACSICNQTAHAAATVQGLADIPLCLSLHLTYIHLGKHTPLAFTIPAETSLDMDRETHTLQQQESGHHQPTKATTTYKSESSLLLIRAALT